MAVSAMFGCGHAAPPGHGRDARATGRRAAWKGGSTVSMPKPQILKSSMVVAFFNLLSGLTAILVETSIAANLGLSQRSDAFYVAYTVPYIICNLLNATSQFSLVPFFASLESGEDKSGLWRGWSYVLNMLSLWLGALALIGAVAAHWIVHAIAPGFTPQEIVVATQLCRWLFLIIIPAGIGEVMRSFLLSRNSFALSSASGFIRNLTCISVIVVGFHRYGSQAIFLGYLSGYLLQVIILGAQIALAFRPRYTLVFSGQGESFRRLHGAGTAQLGTALGWQGVVVVERIIASFLPEGTLTALNYGFRIQGSLSELLGGSVGIAAFPALSRAVARQDVEEERSTFRETFRLSLVLLTPMMVFCLLLNHSIIRLFFQRGKFTPEATDLMAMVLFYYSLSLLPYAFIRILSFYMFARNEGGAYLRLALLLYLLNVGFDLLFVGIFHFGARSIPLGLLGASAVTAWLAYRRNLCGLRVTLDRSLGIFSSKVVVAALACAAVVAGLRFEMIAPARGIAQFGYLCLLCGVGVAVFLPVLAVTRAIAFPPWLRGTVDSAAETQTGR